MSAEADTTPPGKDWSARMAPAAGWSWRKTMIVILLALAAHLAAVFVFGAKKSPAKSNATNVPQFQIAGDSELIALHDPTLFVLPHAEDFVPAVWRRMPVIMPPSFRWTEPPPFLAPVGEVLGAAFGTYMESNRFAQPPLDFKPVPQVTAPVVTAESLLPEKSALQIAGDLAQRRLLQPISLPTLAEDDVIPPSRTQLLVDAAGKVVSVVLLDASGLELADTNALAIARAARFAPAGGLTIGEFIFNWHTVPKMVATTNTP
jgi:hypothetical protein